MPWTEITRPDYDRRGLRYASDTTDAEWEFVAPFLEPRSAVGRPREVSMRNVWDAIQYIAASGWPMADAANGFSAGLDGAVPLLPPARRRAA